MQKLTFIEIGRRPHYILHHMAHLHLLFMSQDTGICIKNEPNIIVNLQGDMPNLNPTAIEKLLEHMRKKTCDIGTLASDFENKKEN